MSQSLQASTDADATHVEQATSNAPRLWPAPIYYPDDESIETDFRAAKYLFSSRFSSVVDSRFSSVVDSRVFLFTTFETFDLLITTTKARQCSFPEREILRNLLK